MVDRMAKRIMKEIEKIRNGDFKEVEINIPDESNIRNLNAILNGPEDTAYEGIKYHISIKLGVGYPMKPPIVKFVSKIYHPNVGHTGSICLDILQNNWSPAMSIANIITSLQLLLQEPNPSSPLNSDAAKLFISNKGKYTIKVKSLIGKTYKNK